MLKKMDSVSDMIRTKDSVSDMIRTRDSVSDMIRIRYTRRLNSWNKVDVTLYNYAKKYFAHT